jgi:hypothetical protein
VFIVRIMPVFFAVQRNQKTLSAEDDPLVYLPPVRGRKLISFNSISTHKKEENNVFNQRKASIQTDPDTVCHFNRVSRRSHEKILLCFLLCHIDENVLLTKKAFKTYVMKAFLFLYC